jgi:hypothetical protein
MIATFIFLNYTFKSEGNNVLNECIPGCLLTIHGIQKISAKTVKFYLQQLKVSSLRNIVFYTMYMYIYEYIISM